MVLQSRNWHFTWNNYNTASLGVIESLKDETDYICYGKEVAPSSGTPHLQGVIRFKKKKRMKGVKALLNPSVYLDVTSNMEAMIEYCKKDEDFVEYGEYINVQGKRTDLDRIRDMVLVDNLVNKRTWMTEYINLYAPNRHIIHSLIEEWYQINVPTVESLPLFKWQSDLWHTLEGPVDPRKIIFVVDPQGNSGKTYFTKLFQSRNEYECDVMSPAESKNLCYLYKRETRFLFVDVPLSYGDLDYTFLEQVKDGHITSTKYMPENKRFSPPHVVVLTNVYPNTNMLIRDRYSIYEVNESNKKYVETYLPINIYHDYNI